MLNDKSNLPVGIKMKMIKQQTKSLIIKELNDYANDMTDHYNECVEQLNTKLL